MIYAAYVIVVVFLLSFIEGLRVYWIVSGGISDILGNIQYLVEFYLQVQQTYGYVFHLR